MILELFVCIRVYVYRCLWCDLGFVPNSCGNKAAANLSPTGKSLKIIKSQNDTFETLKCANS